MSKMGDMIVTIEEYLQAGMTPKFISDRLGIPLSWVYSVENNPEGPDYDYTEEEQYHAEHQ